MARLDSTTSGLVEPEESGTVPSMYSLAEEQEYETQFFGFTPQSFSDGMYNAVIEYTWDFFKAAQELMKSEFSSVITDEQLKKAADTILPQLNKTIDKTFDKFEMYLLKNIFYVPNKVLLPEDQVQHQHPHTSHQDSALDADIQRLKEKIQNAKYVNSCLRQELKDLEMVQREYDNFLEELKRLEKANREAGVLDLHESLVFCMEKAAKLMSTLHHVQPLQSSKRQYPQATPEEQIRLKKSKR